MPITLMILSGMSSLTCAAGDFADTMVEPEASSEYACFCDENRVLWRKILGERL